jgi:hypothetical protein
VYSDAAEGPAVTGKGPRRKRANRAREEVMDAAPDLEVEVTLLREENARLKTELRRPADLGTAIRKLREIASESGEAEAGDYALAAFASALAVSAGLERACLELETASASVRGRLRQLSSAGNDAVFEILSEANVDDAPSLV